MAIVYNDLTVSLTKPNDNLIVEMVRADSGRGLRIFVSDDVITSNSSNVDESLHAILWTKKPSGLMALVLHLYQGLKTQMHTKLNFQIQKLFKIS